MDRRCQDDPQLTAIVDGDAYTQPFQRVAHQNRDLGIDAANVDLRAAPAACKIDVSRCNGKATCPPDVFVRPWTLRHRGLLAPRLALLCLPSSSLGAFCRMRDALPRADADGGHGHGRLTRLSNLIY